MNRWNKWIRQVHRWTSIVFVVFVLVNIGVAFADIEENLAIGIGLSTLAPLAVLLFTGLYLFALPYLVKGKVPSNAQGVEEA